MKRLILCALTAYLAVAVWGQTNLHGWPDIGKDMELFADWFDEHLRGLTAKPAGS